ncbi:MAG: hypothetical protein ABIG46_00605 [Candidatus Omnitrophota bacterium]|nr:hypothetical protein [Candidatus Omnitrophota bacterium]
MNLEQAAKMLGNYMNVNFQLLPYTAEMAARRYLKQYLDIKNKNDFTEAELPDFGIWLAGNLKKVGLIREDLVEKMLADFSKEKDIRQI